jgi:murein DD-endopeptidase MepM/ murein hydrolase activator NlpD
LQQQLQRRKNMQKTIVQCFVWQLLLLGLLGAARVLGQESGQEEESLQPTGMAKPLADLRDYNGTYDGSVGTGSIGYGGGTLYRDNQDNGARSGCVGEGCGRHPGVDIPVPMGTKVYSTLWSQVVISRCDKSWGGLLVLRAQSPWTGETIYITYAHLSARVYSNDTEVLPGHFVSAGVMIGRTGGAGGRGKCSGRSSGPHLHYQIDKDDGNPEPWFPAEDQLNLRDDNFQVTAKTLNPIPFVVGGYRWTFARNGDRELWDLFNLQSWGVGDNALWVDAGFDPYIRRGGNTNCGRSRPCSSSIAADAGIYRQVYLDLYNHCSTGSGKIYFTTSSSPNWSEDKTVPFTNSYGPQRLHVWMPSNFRWSGVITGLRIDPAEQCSSGFDPTYYGEITLER